jgi:hypothetical protein
MSSNRETVIGPSTASADRRRNTAFDLRRAAFVLAAAPACLLAYAASAPAQQVGAATVSIANASSNRFVVYFSERLRDVARLGNRHEIAAGDAVEFECEVQYCFIRYTVRGRVRTERVYSEREYIFERRGGRWGVYRYGE